MIASAFNTCRAWELPGVTPVLISPSTLNRTWRIVCSAFQAAVDERLTFFSLRARSNIRSSKNANDTNSVSRYAQESRNIINEACRAIVLVKVSGENIYADRQLE